MIAQPGYDATSRVFYDAPPNLVIPIVPEVPTPDDVNRAKALFFDHLFKDFPFRADNNASRAHALAALLLFLFAT